jgi:hypothetical protein
MVRIAIFSDYFISKFCFAYYSTNTTTFFVYFLCIINIFSPYCILFYFKTKTHNFLLKLFTNYNNGV